MSHLVAPRMLGCWRRAYIRFEDGSEDTATRVIWLQTGSAMADMRVPPRTASANARSLAQCDRPALLEMADVDCSCGITDVDDTATPYPTARWPDTPLGFAMQPVSFYPEPGWLQWRDQGTCMMEWAPSGAYEEDWRLCTSNVYPTAHLHSSGPGPRRNLYLAGDYAVLACDRPALALPAQPLTQIARDHADDLDYLRALVGCEYSLLHRRAEQRWCVTLSTFPWHEGELRDLSWAYEQALSRRVDTLVQDPGDGRQWRMVGL